MNLPAVIPPEHPLHGYLKNVRAVLSAYEEPVLRLKEKIVAQLCSWDQQLQGMEWDGEGTFIYDGIRERLALLLPEDIWDSIEIENQGEVNLCDADRRTLIGQIYRPHGRDWNPGQSNAFKRDIETVTFVPYCCNRTIHAEDALPGGPGPFQLSDEESRAAQAAIAGASVGVFARVAKSIHADEERGEYRDLRVTLNLQHALHACEWILENLQSSPENLRSLDRPPKEADDASLGLFQHQ